jgi:hypothetical protein
MGPSAVVERRRYTRRVIQLASNLLRRPASRLLPFLPGVVGFVAVVGTRPLRVSNIRWLQADDPFKDYMGWTFFRHGPWTLPIGANPTWGLDKLGSSVFFSDSIPLLAIAFKPFDVILAEPFQYFGLWLLACFLLQSYFAWRLVSTVAAGPAARLFGTLLFVFAPPMMARVGIHQALAGQWVLLAALWFNVSPPRRRTMAWSLLCATSALVHPYLMAMVIALWAASWATLTAESRAIAPRLVEGLVILACCVVTLWQGGAFLIHHGLERAGFGEYRMNLNALFNPRLDATSRWSYVVPDLTGVSPGEYEGFNFLGLGALVCMVAAVALALAHRSQVRAMLTLRSIPLVIVSLCLALAALTNDVSIGSRVVHYPMPDLLLSALGLLRGSGRLFWPVFYLLLFCCVAVVVKTVRPAGAAALLGIIAAVQMVDTSAGWRSRHDLLNSHSGYSFPSLEAPLRDPFWTRAGSLYRTVHIVPWRPMLQYWMVFAVYADEHRMSTDSVYLTRIDQDRLASVEGRQLDALGRGEFEARSLYILDESIAATVAGRVDPKIDLLKQIDGFWVLAPRWYAVTRQGREVAVS